MKWLRSSHDKSGLNPLHAKERCCSASFLISLSVGYTGRDNRSHNSLRQQHLNQPLSAITTSKHHQVNILRCLLTCLAFLSYYQAYSQVLLAILGAFIQMMLLIETEEWSYVGLTKLKLQLFSCNDPSLRCFTLQQTWAPTCCVLSKQPQQLHSQQHWNNAWKL